MNHLLAQEKIKFILNNVASFYFQPDIPSTGAKTVLLVHCSFSEAVTAMTAWLLPSSTIHERLPPAPYIRVVVKGAESCSLTLCGGEQECLRLLQMSGLLLPPRNGTTGIPNGPNRDSWLLPLPFISNMEICHENETTKETPRVEREMETQSLLYKKELQNDLQFEVSGIQTVAQNSVRDRLWQKREGLVDMTESFNNVPLALPRVERSVQLYPPFNSSGKSSSERSSNESLLLPKKELFHESFPFLNDRNTALIKPVDLSSPNPFTSAFKTQALKNQVLDNLHLIRSENNHNFLTLSPLSEPRNKFGGKVRAKTSALTLFQSTKLGRLGAFPLAGNLDISNFGVSDRSCSSQIITEVVKLNKKEISAVIGPRAENVEKIRLQSNCLIVLVPVTNEMITSRGRKRDYLHTVRLSGQAQQVARAKNLLRRALLEVRSQ